MSPSAGAEWYAASHFDQYDLGNTNIISVAPLPNDSSTNYKCVFSKETM